MTTLKEKIIAESQRIGIDKIGFTSAAPFLELEAPLKKQRELGFNSGFEHQDIAERIYLEKTFEQPRSIIAIALAYPTKIHEEIPRDEKRGLFARASWGVDYHVILQDKMKQLIAFIKAEAEKMGAADKWRLAPQVDTGELVDVRVAERAGLGFVGRNGLLITEEFGSWVYLGEIVTNIAFETDAPGVFGCGTCTRCIKACPTQALLGDGGLNAKRCLSYQTQTKDFMPDEFRKKMSNVIYGCDICQLVCPYNQGKDFQFHAEMAPKLDEVAPKLKPLLTLTNRQFKEQFGHLAGSWRGKNRYNATRLSRWPICVTAARCRIYMPAYLMTCVRSCAAPPLGPLDAWLKKSRKLPVAIWRRLTKKKATSKRALKSRVPATFCSKTFEHIEATVIH